jgi:hypothetical protein
MTTLNCCRIVSFLVPLTLAALVASANDEAPRTDQYGGLLALRGTTADMFHLEKLGKRWWLVTPDGHGMFIRAISKVSSYSNMDWGGSGGYQSYDAVYLETIDGRLSANLKLPAEDTLPADVKLEGSECTVKNAGDAIYIGSERFKPNFTYFWMSRLGEGGRMEWYYSTADDWKKINDTGNPAKGVALGEGQTFSFEVGNYIAPDSNGEGRGNDPKANKITFWNLTAGFPVDFAKARLPNDVTPRFWLKGVVVQSFKVAPLLNQTFERAEFEETTMRKYGPGDCHLKWAAAMTDRMKSWGMNAVGMYSYCYTEKASQLTPRLPIEATWQISGAAMKAPYAVKNMYAGAVFPPGGRMGWAAKHADPFDVNYKQALMDTAEKSFRTLDKWTWAVIPEEADWLFGFNYLEHNHLGYVVLSQNPYRAEDPVTKVKHADTKFYAKYALRDFLRYRYKGAEEALVEIGVDSKVPLYDYHVEPGADGMQALQRLNKAWGTAYTTWETSAGNLSDGTNAYIKGAGFLDEDGRGVVAPKVKTAWYKENFTRQDAPAIRKDLDDFVAVVAARYGSILKAACDQKAHPPLLLPIYRGVDMAVAALAPYVDGFWAKPQNEAEATAMYALCHKPILVADYEHADPDSQAYFKTAIKEIRFDKKSGNTIIHCPDLRYYFRSLQFIHFPEADELNKSGRAGTKYVPARPRIGRVSWNTFEIPGDYTESVKPGMFVEFLGGYTPEHKRLPHRTQEERAKFMTGVIDSTLLATGDDGCQFVVGWEHWCLYDAGVNNTFEVGNWGIATMQDNSYDGIEAKRAAATDARGYPTGGEEKDYGNLLSPLGDCLRSIDQKLIKQQ